MKTPLVVIEDMLVEHKLNTLAVYDTAEKLRLYFLEGAPDVLVEKLRELSRRLEGAFLVKAWKRTPRQSGRRPDSEATYTWIVQGRKDDAPIAGVGGVPENVVNELAQLRAEKMLRDQADAEDDGEDDDEGEPAGNDPMGRLVDMLGDLLKPKGAPEARAAANVHRGHPEAMTKERMARILAAVRNCHETDPDTFAQYEGALLSQYGQRKAS